MIEMQSNGKYVILGEDKAHPSLPDLVQHHSRVGIKPFNELLTTSCGQVSTWVKPPLGSGSCRIYSQLAQALAGPVCNTVH